MTRKKWTIALSADNHVSLCFSSLYSSARISESCSCIVDSRLLAMRVFKPSCLDSQSDCWHVQATFRGIFKFTWWRLVSHAAAVHTAKIYVGRWYGRVKHWDAATIRLHRTWMWKTVCRTIQPFYSTGSVSKWRKVLLESFPILPSCLFCILS